MNTQPGPADPHALPGSKRLAGARAIPADQITTRQGKDVVLYPGLLHAAHTGGLVALETQALQLPAQPGDTCIFLCTATFDDGTTWQAIGDATPENVHPMVAPHYIRMAETRAKARALRDALSIRSAVDETGTEEDAPTPRPAAAAPARATQQKQTTRPAPPTVQAPPDQRPASDTQRHTIAKISRLLGEGPGMSDQPTLTSTEASEEITRLSREYNARRRPARAG